MKSLIQIGICGFLFMVEAQAQHFHLNIGAQSQAQNSPLFFQNGGTFVTNSGFVMPLPFNSSGTYAGHNATTSLTPTAIGTGFFNPPAPGAQVRLRFVSVTGPDNGSFGVWDVPGFNESGDPSISVTFSIPSGTTNGTNSILLSENNGEPDADPFGHIHGRAFSASVPGLYIVTVQAFDNSSNGATNGPIHTPGVSLPIYFQAGVTIARLERSGLQIALSFASRAGSSYFLQATATPEINTSWQDIAGPFTGNVMQTTGDTTGNTPVRFYRLRVTTP